jgi:hypothetical protein
MDLKKNTYTIFHPADMEYIFFSAASSKIDHISEHKENLFFVVYTFIHMCIHCLGPLFPLPLLPFPHLPLFQGEPVPPSSLILLKRKHKR